MEHELLDWIDITQISSVMLAQNSNPSAIHLIKKFPDFYNEITADSSPGCIGLSENSNATKGIREISSLFELGAFVKKPYGDSFIGEK
jgi:hypothetical protein